MNIQLAFNKINKLLISQTMSYLEIGSILNKIKMEFILNYSSSTAIDEFYMTTISETGLSKTRIRDLIRISKIDTLNTKQFKSFTISKLVLLSYIEEESLINFIKKHSIKYLKKLKYIDLKDLIDKEYCSKKQPESNEEEKIFNFGFNLKSESDLFIEQIESFQGSLKSIQHSKKSIDELCKLRDSINKIIDKYEKNKHTINL